MCKMVSVASQETSVADRQKNMLLRTASNGVKMRFNLLICCNCQVPKNYSCAVAYARYKYAPRVSFGKRNHLQGRLGAEMLQHTSPQGLLDFLDLKKIYFPSSRDTWASGVFTWVVTMGRA